MAGTLFKRKTMDQVISVPEEIIDVRTSSVSAGMSGVIFKYYSPSWALSHLATASSSQVVTQGPQDIDSVGEEWEERGELLLAFQLYSIHFMHQTLKTQCKTKSNDLVSLWQMFDDVVEYSEDPSGTTQGIAAIKTKFEKEWRAYESARKAIGTATKGHLKVYHSRCEKILKTLLRTADFDRLQNQIVTNLESHTGISGVEITLDEIDPINLYKSFSVLFKDPETPQPVDADRMGSGVQSAVVISLLQAYRELHKEAAILLLEEPELFLHPHGRRHLYRLLCDLAGEGAQVIYTTHSQDFVNLERMDGVRLVSKDAQCGTAVRCPTNAPISQDWRQRLRQIRQFSSPRNEVFFAESVVLVEGTTELGAISHLAQLMPSPLDFDRKNCSIIETGGKDSLPMFIKMMQALGKRILVICDTDSDKTTADDVATNQKRNEAIQDALSSGGELFECDPYFEDIAGITGTSKKDKESKMRAHLSSFTSWEEVPGDLKAMMEKVAAVCNETV